MKAGCSMFFNNRGSSLIFVVSLAIILNIVFVTVYMTISSTQKKTGVKRLNVNSVLLAEAGKEKLYADIQTGGVSLTPNARVPVYSAYSLGAGTFTVTCSTNASIDTAWIESWGKDQTSETGIGVVAAISVDAVFNPVPVKAAVTSRPSVDCKGSIDVDGRDYDSTGSKIVDLVGVNAINTCGTLSIGTATGLCGNNFCIGKKASAADIDKVSDQGISVTSELASPEAFLGVTSGSLDKYKIAEADLTFPFHGVRYLEASVGTPLHIGGSSGILIVHSAMKNATLHINGTGTFKGVVIVDEMDKMNGNVTVVGAVACLADFAGAKMFGNGSAYVKYSTQVLNNLGNFITDGDKSVKELSWKELKK